MSVQDDVAKFTDLIEEIKNRSILVSEIKDQNAAYEKENSKLEGTKSALLAEIKAIKEEKRGISISRSKILKGFKVDKQSAKKMGKDLNQIINKKGKLVGEVDDLGNKKTSLIKENKELVSENSVITKEMDKMALLTKESMQTLSDLQEQLEVKEMLLNKRTKKLDLREEALN